MTREWIALLGCLWAAGCAASVPAATATAASTLAPLPSATVTLALTATPSPEPALTRTPIALPPGRDVVFEESTTEALTGTLYGEGETAILLANMSIGGVKQWDPFVAEVDKVKFTTITFNYRDVDDVGADAEQVLEWLRGEGFARVICIGASVGARACSTIATEPEIAGLVLIAGPVQHASVAAAKYPKLFISGALDVRAFDIEQGYEQAAEPRQLVLFEDNRAHGTDLFASKDADAFLALLIDFVNGIPLQGRAASWGGSPPASQISTFVYKM